MTGDCCDAIRSDIMFPYSGGWSDETGGQAFNWSVKLEKEGYDE
jgi:hypothetical protein